MRSKAARLPGLVLGSALISSVSGCGTQAVLVKPGGVVRLAETIKARVYVPDGQGGYVASANKSEIPAGWYVLPPPSQATTAPAR